MDLLLLLMFLPSLHIAELDPKNRLKCSFTNVWFNCKSNIVKVVRDKYTGHPMGYAYVNFEDDSQVKIN